MRSRKVRWYRSRGFAKQSKCGRFAIIPRLASGSRCPLICETKPTYYDLVDHHTDVTHVCLSTQKEGQQLADKLAAQDNK